MSRARLLISPSAMQACQASLWRCIKKSRADDTFRVQGFAFVVPFSLYERVAVEILNEATNEKREAIDVKRETN